MILIKSNAKIKKEKTQNHIDSERCKIIILQKNT